MKKTKLELAFTKANKARKRVIIAKDVLEQIRVGRYLPTKGTYISTEELQEFKVTDQIQKAIKKTKTCSVCALGSVFMSGIGLGNALKFSDLYDYGYLPLSTNLIDVAGDDDFMRESLSKYFDISQLEHIEWAFEYWRNKGQAGFYFPYFNKYGEEAYEEEAYEDTSRLVIIMLNIIDNQGTFVFDQPYDSRYDHLVGKYTE